MTNDLSTDKILQAVKTPAVALSIIFASNKALSLGLSMLWGIISVIVLISGKFQ